MYEWKDSYRLDSLRLTNDRAKLSDEILTGRELRNKRRKEKRKQLRK